MVNIEGLDRKLKRLRSLEASYRKEIKMAEEDVKHGRMTRAKYEKIRSKREKKINKFLSKIKVLSMKRTELLGK